MLDDVVVEEPLPNSFLNVSAEANSCGSIMRQPTELAVLLEGISMGPLADSCGKVNTCEAKELDVNELKEEGVVYVFDELAKGFADADDDDADATEKATEDAMSPIIGFAVKEGGKCTVGKDGTGNIMVLGGAVAEPVIPLGVGILKPILLGVVFILLPAFAKFGSIFVKTVELIGRLIAGAAVFKAGFVFTSSSLLLAEALAKT